MGMVTQLGHKIDQINIFFFLMHYTIIVMVPEAKLVPHNLLQHRANLKQGKTFGTSHKLAKMWTMQEIIMLVKGFTRVWLKRYRHR